MAQGTDVQARPRIPKLKYRNPLPDDQPSLDRRPASINSSSNVSLTDSQAAPLSPLSRISTSSASLASAPSATSTVQPPFDITSLRSVSVASTPSNASSSNGSMSSKKKKKSKSNGVLGFLTLKEPSQIALEQFAEQQRKQTNQKSGVASPVGSSSFMTTKKLPETVPKVNSKWDGVPQSRKAKDSSSSSSASAKRNSTTSRGSGFSGASSTPASPITPLSPGFPTGMSVLSFTSDGTYNPPNSLASPATSSSDVTIYGRRDSGPLSSPSMDSLPEMTYYFPDNPNPSGVMSPTSIHANLLPPKVSPPETTDSFPDTSGPSDVLPRSSIQNSLHNAIAGPAGPASPRPAPDAESGDGLWDTAGVIYKKLNDRPQHGLLAGEAWEQVIPEEEEEDLVPESHDFLFDFATTSSSISEIPQWPLPSSDNPANQPMNPTPQAPRPRTSMPYRPAPVVSRLSTLYEASIASTDTLTTARPISVKGNDSVSIASAAAPSEQSTPNTKSPIERLGFGRNSSKHDTQSGKGHGETGEKTKKSRLGIFSKTTSRT